MWLVGLGFWICILRYMVTCIDELAAESIKRVSEGAARALQRVHTGRQALRTCVTHAVEGCHVTYMKRVKVAEEGEGGLVYGALSWAGGGGKGEGGEEWGGGGAAGGPNTREA